MEPRNPDQEYRTPVPQVPGQRVSLPGVELKGVRGEPVAFDDDSDIPTAYTGTLHLAFKNLEALEFWRLQRTFKAGHSVTVSVEYNQGHLDGAGESPANGQLPIPESAYHRIG